MVVTPPVVIFAPISLRARRTPLSGRLKMAMKAARLRPAKMRKLAPAKLYLVSWLSVADAKTAAGNTVTTKGYVLGYNGVRLDTFAGDVTTLGSTGLAAADRAKVVNGSYTAWGYEQLLYPTGNATAQIVFTDLKSRLNSASVIGNAGLPLGEMLVNRQADGSTVVPGALP